MVVDEAGWREMVEAWRDTAPVMVGVVPYGVAYGILARKAGLTVLEAGVMSLAVFAGAAQFVAVGMIAAGNAAVGLVTLSTALVNLRHVLMGASLGPYLKDVGAGWQALLAFGMADESYALTVSRFSRVGASRFYQLGANLLLYVVWAACSFLGAAAGALFRDPLAWGLDFAMPATFIALVFSQLTDRRAAIVAIVAALAAAAGVALLPGRWYVIVASVAAVSFGGVLEGICGSIISH